MLLKTIKFMDFQWIRGGLSVPRFNKEREACELSMNEIIVHFVTKEYAPFRLKGTHQKLTLLFLGWYNSMIFRYSWSMYINDVDHSLEQCQLSIKLNTSLTSVSKRDSNKLLNSDDIPHCAESHLGLHYLLSGTVKIWKLQWWIAGRSIITLNISIERFYLAWMGLTLTIHISDCGNVLGFTGGTISYTSGTTYLSVASFTCDNGYEMTTTNTRTCQAGGTWSDANAVCDPISKKIHVYVFFNCSYPVHVTHCVCPCMCASLQMNVCVNLWKKLANRYM